MSEKLNPNLKELKFGGEGKAESIKRGFAITTLRNPRIDYFFERGQTILADCLDDGEKVPVTIISNVTEPLNKFSIPQLALDGFFSTAMAVKEMRSYPGYEKTHRNSPMQAITFVSEESIKTIPESLKDALLFDNFDELVRMRELRHLFFPTMCFHFSNYGGPKEWIEFLGDNKLITSGEKRAMENYEVGGRNISDLLENHTGVFQKLAFDTRVSFFRPMVLGLFDNPTEGTPKG